jgi:hypothetical protein
VIEKVYCGNNGDFKNNKNAGRKITELNNET